MPELCESTIVSIACFDPRGVAYSIEVELNEMLGTERIVPITAPGIVGILAGSDSHGKTAILEWIEMAVTELGATVISIAAHEDCKGYPRGMEDSVSAAHKAIAAITDYLGAEDLRFLVWWQRMSEPDVFEENFLVYDSTQPA